MTDEDQKDRLLQSEDGSELRWYRSKTGETVHRADCHLAAAGQPWNFADGMDRDALLSVMAERVWLKPCGVCKPLAVSS